MKVLVTGAMGFLGVPLQSALRAHGHDVCLPPPYVEQAPGQFDITRPATVAATLERHRPDAIIHAAARFGADFNDLFGVNVGGTASILHTMRELGLRLRLVFVSSSAVYGDVMRGPVIDEEHPLHAVTAYGLSKVAAESLVRAAAVSGALPACIVRPFNLLGPGQPARLLAGNLAAQIVAAERGGPSTIRLGDLRAIRDFVDVRDAAEGCVRALERGVPGAAYNLCSGVGTHVRELVSAMQKLAKLPVSVEARELAGDAPPSSQVGDTRKASEEIGFRSSRLVEQSVRDLLDEVRQRPLESAT